MDHKFFREKGVNDVSGITETTTGVPLALLQK